ncbi:MAG: hypothetical protein JXJ04_19055, partial [Spirochaetales bacterium]|nr:hypothetical protein [Spirochaetales bacterium]
SFPLSGKEVPKKGSHYASFVKKVLHHKDSNQRNKVILFSDKPPADMADALHYGRLFKKNNIDFTQIILCSPGLKNQEQDGDRIASLSQGTSQFARVCGGNQVVVTRHESTPIVFLETYDRYLGILTLLDPGYHRPLSKKQTPLVKENGREISSHGKVVKKWQPKKLKRGN